MSKDILVVGASAGGVSALQELVGGLPGDLGAAVFVVLHIPASGPNLLTQLLQRSSALKVLNPAHGAPIAKRHIYVAPPDHHLLIDQQRIYLTRGHKENWHRPSIDLLFRSAACSYGARVIGVILTGDLDDGAAGLWAVKQWGERRLCKIRRVPPTHQCLRAHFAVSPQTTWCLWSKWHRC